MTVSKDYNKHVYEGNGLTRDWPYDFDLPITAAGAPDTSLIHVFRTNLRGEVSEVTTGYSINAETGTLTCPTSGSPLETGEKLTILRLLDVRQQFFDPSNQANLYPETLEDNTDRLVMMIQQIDEEVGRAVTMGEGYEGEEVTAEGLLEARDIAISAAATAEGYAAQLPAIADELGVNLVADEADLIAKLTTIGASKATLVIATPIPLTGDLSIPSNVSLVFKNTGQLQPATGTTLTVNGPIDAGLWQIFGGEGETYLRSHIHYVYPQWFGTVGDGITDDSIPFKKALRGLGPGHILYITDGTYMLSTWTTYVQAKQLKIEGADRFHVTIVGPGETGSEIPFINCDKNLEIKGITFTNWNRLLLGGKISMEFLILDNVSVLDSAKVIGDDPQTAIGEYEDDEDEPLPEIESGNSILYFAVKNCLFDNIAGFVFYINVYMEKAEIIDSEFNNTDLYIFRNLTAFDKLIFARNKVVDHHSKTAGGMWGVARVLQTRGRDTQITDCHFENLSANIPGVNEACTGNTNVIYNVGGGEFLVIGNIIKNCGDLIFSSINYTGLFTCKSAVKSFIVTGNTFTNPDVDKFTLPVVVQATNAVVSNNVFSDWVGAPVVTTWAYTENLTVTGNTFDSIKSDVIIHVRGALRTATITGNIFDNISYLGNEGIVTPSAIAVESSAAPALTENITITNNNFGTIVGLDANGDEVPGVNAAVNLKPYGKELPFAAITNNVFANNGYPLSLRTYTSGMTGSIGTLSFSDNQILNASEVEDPIYMPSNVTSIDKLIIAGNKGACLLKSNGTATIPNGESSVTVTHNLYKKYRLSLGTPSEINVIPMSADGAGFWISNVGDTSFKINLSSGTSGDVSFMWSANGEKGVSA